MQRRFGGTIIGNVWDGTQSESGGDRNDESRAAELDEVR
jgi:hypothetical protein